MNNCQIITGGIVEGTKLTDKMFTTRNGRQFQEIGRLPSPRSGHCVVPLKEKKVFVGGGVGQSGEILEDASIFDPNGGSEGDENKNLQELINKNLL